MATRDQYLENKRKGNHRDKITFSKMEDNFQTLPSKYSC